MHAHAIEMKKVQVLVFGVLTAMLVMAANASGEEIDCSGYGEQECISNPGYAQADGACGWISFIGECQPCSVYNGDDSACNSLVGCVISPLSGNRTCIKDPSVFGQETGIETGRGNEDHKEAEPGGEAAKPQQPGKPQGDPFGYILLILILATIAVITCIVYLYYVKYGI